MSPVPTACPPLLSPIAAAVLFVLAHAPAAAQGAATATPAAEQQLQRVTITATKRETALLETPVSVTAVTGAELEASGTRDVIDALGRVPGLSVETARPGYNKFTLRGVNAGGPYGWRQGAATATYLDDIPLTTRTNFWFAAPDLNLYDLERLEVLRGPQGTLFGASAIGGAVRAITPAPDTRDFFGRASVEGGKTSGSGGLNGAVRAAVNVPLQTDTLGLRISAEHARDAGFLDAIKSRTQDVAAAAATQPRIRDYNDLTRDTLRMALAYTPDRTLTLTPALYAQRSRGGGQSNGRLNALGDATIFAFNPAFEASGEPYERVSDQITLASLKVEKKLPWFGGSTFTSLTGLQRRTAQQRDDVNAYNGNWVEGYGFDDNYNASLEPNFADFGTRVRQLTQELRLQSEGKGALHFVGGLFYNRLQQDDSILYDFRGSQQALLDANGLTGTVTFDGRDKFRETQTAAYGDVSFAVTPAWKLSAGLRWTRYTQTLDRFSRSPAFGDDAGSGDTLTASATKLTPRLSVSYQPDAGFLAYALVSEGFRTGGGNPADVPIAGRCPNRADLPAKPSQFKPDSAWNFELGVKTALLDNRVNVSAALFQLDWKDIQTAVLYNCSDNTTINWTGNAGRATVRGLELEAAALLGAGWRVTGSAAYTDAKFSEDAPEANITRGVRLPFVPRVTASLGVDWRGAPLLGAWRPSARVDHRYVSQRLDPNNGPAALGDRGVDLAAYALTNLRFGLGDGRWNVSVFVNNALNKDVALERVAVFVPSGFVAPQADRLREEYVVRPRTIGLTLETRF